MRGLKNKFVLVDNQLIAGRVTLHKELHEKPLGGGWWYYHKEQRKLILYGTSHDFGSVIAKQLKDVILRGSFRSLKGVEIIFDERDHIYVLDILTKYLGYEEALKAVTECDFI